MEIPQRFFSTFSVTGFDPETGDLGAVVASKFHSVGSACLAGLGGVGIIANQSWYKADFNPKSMMHLESGVNSTDVLEALLKTDPEREYRQVSIIDSAGSVATYTGKRCQPWAGHHTGRYCSAQGNVLTGPDVVKAMVSKFESTEGDLLDKLMEAIAAGDAAGGDMRGRQSAAILVVRKNSGFRYEGDKLVDLRVDDHPDPINEMRRLIKTYDAQVLHRLGSRDMYLMEGPDVHELQKMLKVLGFYTKEPDGWFDRDTHDSVRAFERAVGIKEWGYVSKPTLTQILAEFAKKKTRA